MLHARKQKPSLKIKNSMGIFMLEEVRLSVDINLSKEEKIGSIEDNIEYMLEYLREVVGQVKEQTNLAAKILKPTNKRTGKELKLADDGLSSDVIIAIDDDASDLLEERKKKYRQARYRKMLTNFYFGSY